MNSRAVGSTGGGGGGGGEDFILIRDEKATNINGGSFTSGAWRTRDLNIIVSDVGGHASLAANQVTLVAGTYRFEGYAPGFSVNSHKCKLYNVTDAVDIAIGTSTYAPIAYSGSDQSMVEGKFTILDTKILELQHRCSQTKANNGMGILAGFGVIEVYSVLKFWKES